jgi:hypothetical protein
LLLRLRQRHSARQGCRQHCQYNPCSSHSSILGNAKSPSRSVTCYVRLMPPVKRIKCERLYLSASTASASVHTRGGRKSPKDDLPVRIAVLAGRRSRSFRLLLRLIP